MQALQKKIIFAQKPIMRKLLLFALLFCIAACGVKSTEKKLASGNYDAAIESAARNLQTNKDKKRKEEYIALLEHAYSKAKERDERNIALWAKDAKNPENLESIYNTYLRMNDRQDQIRPLLPLRLNSRNREAVFIFEDLSDEIVSSKASLAEYLYNDALYTLQNGSKMDARKAYSDLEFLLSLSPNYKNTQDLLSQAKFKGTDHVLVSTNNDTKVIIPADLQADLLNISTYGLDDKWTTYHNRRQPTKINYDFGLVINFKNILISPEQVKEKEFIKEKQVKDGEKKLLDANGNVVKDSLGNAIMVDKFKTIRLNIYEFRQLKTCQVTAKVDYVDLNGNQLLNSFPISSEYVFENVYAKSSGDRRAADDNYRSYFDQRAVPFPSNEQMVFDTGEDLKAKIKNIISRNRFR